MGKTRNKASAPAGRSKGKYTLPARPERAGYIQKNFDSIADNYDRFNDLITFGFHRRWKKAVVRETGLARGEAAVALDLCSGTGDIAMLLANHLGPPGRVIALDFSTGMLDIFAGRLQTQGVSYLYQEARAMPSTASLDAIQSDRAAFILIQQGDATQLDHIPDNHVDAVTIGFGLRNVQDRTACLQEVRRVLRPGKALVILDVGVVSNPVARFFSSLYFEKVVPWIGHLTHGKKHEMYEYLPASAKEYPDQKALAQELKELGFVNVRYRKLFLGSAVIHHALAPGG